MNIDEKNKELVTDKNPNKFDSNEDKKEKTSLQIIKSIGFISGLIALIYGHILIGVGIFFLDYIIITILESVYYDSSDLVRYHLRLILIKIFFVILAIAALIILIILFSRSLFEGFIALIAVIILCLLILKD